MKLHIAENLTLPAEAVTQTFAILARRGAGKTYTARVLAEEMLTAGYPIVVLDPTGAWWGLRAGKDGNPSGGRAVVIMGGQRGDVPLEPSSGKVIADFLVSERVPTILDLSAMGEAEMQQFVADLAERFYRTNTEAVHWFVDEADEFAPQDARGGGPLWKCLGAMQRIVRRGRIKGIGCTMITQRSAVLNKSVLTQTECLIALQTTAPQDLAAIEDWLKYQAPKAERPEIMNQLPKLQQGEALVYSPGWLRTLKRVNVRELETFDSGRTPKPGEHRKTPKQLADVDLGALQKKVAATIERAKADDPRELRKQIAELQKAAKAAKPAEADPKVIERAVAQAIRERDAHWAGQVSELKRSNGKMAGKLDRIHRESELNGATLKLEEPPAPISRPSLPVSRPAAPVARRESRRQSAEDTGPLPKGERAVLTAIAQHGDEGVTRSQLSILTGYKRSTRDRYVQFVREKGLIEDGDPIRVNDAGLAALGSDFEPLPTGDALREWWMARLPEGQRRILAFLVENHPDAVDREALSEATQYKRSTRDRYLQFLESRKLVVNLGRGAVCASENLFG